REMEHGDAARAAAQRAAELRPDNADAVGLYGLVLEDGHDRPAALAMLRRAHQLSPDDREYFLAMVRTELDSMEYAGVERDLSSYLLSHPSDAEACYMMAVVFNQKPRTAANLKTATGYAEKA